MAGAFCLDARVEITMMDVRGFLDAVFVEENGWRVAAVKQDDKPIFHHSYRDIGAMAKWVETSNAKGNVYIAHAAFKDEFVVDDKGKKKTARREENALGSRVIVFDLDCQGRDYETDEDAIDHFKNFLADTNLPRPSYIVHTGGGFQLLWVLDRTLPRDDWLALADKVNGVATAWGLRHDRQVTGDISRLIRVHPSHNWKWGRDTRIKAGGHHISADALATAIDPLPYQNPSNSGPKPAAAKGNGEPMTPKPALAESVYMSEIVKRCGALAETLATQGANDPEPRWFATLGVLSLCEDGDKYVHEMSKGHPSYDQQQTDAKYEKQKTKEITQRRRTCDAFSPYSDACKTCPFRSTAHSPYYLGVKSEAILPAGYKQENDVIYVQEFDEEANAYVFSKLTSYRMDLDAFDLVIDDEGSHYVKAGYSTGSWQQQITLPHEKLSDKKNVRRYLASKGMLCSEHEAKRVADFMLSFVEQLQRTRENRNVVPYGWTEDGKSFGLGDKLLSPGGKVSRIMANTDPALLRMYEPHGEYAEWQKRATALVDQGHLPLVAIFATAFASPLVRFLGQRGVCVSATSPQSGLGKTTAMRLAASVWGDPISTMLTLDDTENYGSKRLGKAQSLPAYWDELRLQKQMQSFARLVFRLSQGREKGRLKSDTSMTPGAEWDTMLCVASNSSLVEYMVPEGGGEAGYYRAFEWLVTPPPSHFHAIDLDVTEHYGHAGRVYAQYLVDHSKWVKKYVHRKARWYARNVEAPGERFWISSIVALVCGAYIAKRAGIIPFDHKALERWLLSVLREMRSRKVSDADMMHTPEELLNEYLRSVQNRVLHTDQLHPVGSWKGFSTHLIAEQKPSLDLVAQEAHNPRGLRIASQPFHEHLTNKGVSVTHTVRELRKAGVISDKHRAILGAGTEFGLKRPIYCYDILNYGSGAA